MNVSTVDSGPDITEANAGVLQLVDLPHDLLLIILSELDIQSLLVCKLVCRGLAYIIGNDVFLQYVIELAATGMVDAPSGASGGPPVAARLALLREYRTAWRSLRFTTEVDVGLPAPPPSVEDPRVADISSDGHVVLQLYSDNRLSVLQLPSRVRGIRERRWTIDRATVGVDMAKGVADSTQDLLIVAEKIQPGGRAYFGNIHVRTLSTGAVHPLAARPNLRVNPAILSRFAQIRIRADVVAYVLSRFNPPFSEVRLWNWKTSQLIWYRAGAGAPFFIHSLAFLDGTRFMMAGPNGLTIHSYDAETASLWTHPGLDDNPICTLNFPERAEKTSMHRCQLSVGSRTPPPPSPLPGSRMHFDVPSDDPLVTVSFTTVAVGKRVTHQDFAIIIPRSAVLALIDAAASGGPREFAWREWCSRQMRIMELPMSHAAEDTVLGWRVCGASCAMDMAPQIAVYDFHRFVPGSGAVAGTNGSAAGTRVLVTTAIKSSFPRYFKERVVSSTYGRVCQRRVQAVAAAAGDAPRGHQVHVLFMLDGFVVLDSSMLHGTAYLF